MLDGMECHDMVEGVAGLAALTGVPNPAQAFDHADEQVLLALVDSTTLCHDWPFVLSKAQNSDWMLRRRHDQPQPDERMARKQSDRGHVTRFNRDQPKPS